MTNPSKPEPCAEPCNPGCAENGCYRRQRPGAQAASVEGLMQGNWGHPDGGRIIGWLVPREDVERIGVGAYALPREVASHVARLVAAPSTGGAETATLYVECRECSDCGHAGLNDTGPTDRCSSCEWSGPAPKEDKCPECGAEGTMCSACPKCGGEYALIADARLAAPSTGGAETALNFEFEGLSPLDGMDRIFAEYATTFGRFPDAFMARVVAQTKEDLFVWWGAHREKIRAALAASSAPAQAVEPWRQAAQAEGITNALNHLAVMVDMVEDRNRPGSKRSYQEGAIQVQASYASQWLRSIEAETVRKLCEALRSPVAAQAVETAGVREALTQLVELIDAAGLANLSSGVQLGATVWYVKASDALDYARAVLQSPAASPASPTEIPDNELPGMWERADFMGGQDEVRPAPSPASKEQTNGGTNHE